MTYHFHNPEKSTIFNYLKEAKTIAVVGLSTRTETAAYNVSKIIKDAGYRIIPVNPKLAGKNILGEKVYASLADIPVPVDIVNIFRRSEYLPEIALDFIRSDCKVFWSQVGIENEIAEKMLRDAGCNDIVMNRCIKLEYQQYIFEDKKY